MTDIKPLESAPQTSVFRVEKNLAVKAAEKLGIPLTESYIDEFTLEQIQDVLGDPNFPYYWQADKMVRNFEHKHPDEAKIFNSLGSEGLERATEWVKYHRSPLLNEWETLTNQRSITGLKLSPKVSGPALHLATLYVDEAKIVFPELTPPQQRESTP